jgi:hypothetical protein
MPFHLVHHCQTNGTKFYIVTKPLSLSANPMGFQLLWLSTGLGVRFTIAIHWKNPWTTIAKYAAAPQTTLCMPCLHTFILRKLEQWYPLAQKMDATAFPPNIPILSHGQYGARTKIPGRGLFAKSAPCFKTQESGDRWRPLYNIAPIYMIHLNCPPLDCTRTPQKLENQAPETTQVTLKPIQ